VAHFYNLNSQEAEAKASQVLGQQEDTISNILNQIKQNKTKKNHSMIIVQKWKIQ
jgi:hypothetical protein